jgi:murein L,D-transpeptidase YafK
MFRPKYSFSRHLVYVPTSRECGTYRLSSISSAAGSGSRRPHHRPQESPHDGTNARRSIDEDLQGRTRRGAGWPKTRQGDHRTPEGVYVINGRNAQSQFHRSLHISYPNAADRERAHKLGVSPGGDIFIHGLPNGYGLIGAAHRAHDWTDGCIAVTDQEIEEIWKLVDNGTLIEIRP